MNLIHQLLNLYLIVLVARAVLSWFPLSPGSPLAPVASFLYTVTEPVLGPLRRVIPPLGGFDISFIVAFFALEIINGRIH